MTQRYFSPSTGGFYSEAFHGARLVALEQDEREAKAGKRPKMVENPYCTVPADATPVSEEDYAALMQAQAQGMQIMASGGKPVARVPEPAPSHAAADRRAARDRLLAASDWTQLADALVSAPDVKTAWVSYRQALRDLDMAGSDWPQAPDQGEAT